MSQTLQELVQAYCDEPTSGLRNAIITKSMPLVKSIVGKVNKPDNPLSQFEDLESAGIMGLLHALDNYDNEKNVQFNTFAYYRIRGSIIDYLRKIDEMPRLQRANFGKAQEVMERLQQELGRDPDDDEIAEAMGLSMDEYNQMLMSVQQRSILSLDSSRYDDSGSENLTGYIEDQNTEKPDAELEREGINKILQNHIKKLKERDRIILALYYYEDLTLNEIAMVLGLSEARISQIVGKLLLQLRAALNRAKFER